MRIDLNADLGESPERWASGEDVALLHTVTSANVCCGAYAGDEQLMRTTCAAAVEHGVAIGAQIGYPDREHFGRRHLDMPGDQLTQSLADQIRLLQDIARSAGGRVSYVKPHGALYNTIVTDAVHSQAVVTSILSLVDGPLPLLGLPGSIALDLAAARGVPTRREGFADRGYTAGGTLLPRDQAGALLSDPAEAAEQAVRLLREGVDSICVHSDSPGALEIARTVRAALETAGATVRST